MQENSIQNPAGAATAPEPFTSFPLNGDNFETVAFLPEQADLAAWAEARDLVIDCQIALAAFETEPAGE